MTLLSIFWESLIILSSDSFWVKETSIYTQISQDDMLSTPKSLIIALSARHRCLSNTATRSISPDVVTIQAKLFRRQLHGHIPSAESL